MGEISERGRGLVRQLGTAHIEFQYGSVQRGDVESARDTLLAYIAAHESVVAAARGFEVDHDFADDGPGAFERGLLGKALAALDAVKA